MSAIESSPVLRSAGVHHVTVVTRNACRLMTVLVDGLELPVLGTFSVPFDEVAGLFGWTKGPDPVVSTLLGHGSAGLVEVVEYPDASGQDRSGEGVPTVGAYQLAFGVRDLDQVLAACAGLIDEMNEPRELLVRGALIRLATVCVGGVRIQMSELSTDRSQEDNR